jgi:hypothetical protein
LGKEEVVIWTTPAMLMLRLALALRLLESVTCTVKVDCPGAVGVPVMAPPLLKVKPAGRLPEVILHEKGGVPVVAEREAL